MVSVPELVNDITPVPAAVGVNVNVADAVEPAEIVIVVGENVPTSVEAGVIMTSEARAAPVPGATVYVDASPTVRVVVPETVYVVN
ncbi:hypothetical protein AA21952_2666 [Acetobacter oeni LMG 21952]|nr:hypothetical protein AA21952_2666 [Acetobacter oeni LMG 21952]